MYTCSSNMKLDMSKSPWWWWTACNDSSNQQYIFACHSCSAASLYVSVCVLIIPVLRSLGSLLLSMVENKVALLDSFLRRSMFSWLCRAYTCMIIFDIQQLVHFTCCNQKSLESVKSFFLATVFPMPIMNIGHGLHCRTAHFLSVSTCWHVHEGKWYK